MIQTEPLNLKYHNTSAPWAQEAVKPDQDTLRSLLRNLDCSLQVHQAVRRRAEQLEARLRGLQAQAAAEMVAQVPALVAREILQAFPAFAQQNQLDRMLLEHQGQVRAQLELLAAEALRRIVSEERYHRVNQAYFLAFAHKGQQVCCTIIAADFLFGKPAPCCKWLGETRTQSAGFAPKRRLSHTTLLSVGS